MCLTDVPSSQRVKVQVFEARHRLRSPARLDAGVLRFRVRESTRVLFLCFKPQHLRPVPGATDVSGLVRSLEAAALAETWGCGSHLFLQMRAAGPFCFLPVGFPERQAAVLTVIHSRLFFHPFRLPKH